MKRLSQPCPEIIQPIESFIFKSQYCKTIKYRLYLRVRIPGCHKKPGINASYNGCIILKHIYQILSEYADQDNRVCLATLVATKGSAPQVPGSSAIFSDQGLLAGTLGGGIMEEDARKQSIDVIRSGKHLLYDFRLDAGINDGEGAICGGSATLLLDPDPGMHLECFREMSSSLEQGQPGCLLTLVPRSADADLRRYWMAGAFKRSPGFTEDWPGQEIEKSYTAALKKGACSRLTNEAGDLLFIEPIFPVSKLVIAGAGHVGKALSHMASLLDFEVTVIDNRAELANPENLPDADHIIVQPVGKAMQKIPKSKDTYVVIVTHDHKEDAAALKACIGHELPYVGMIGSRKKVRLLKEKFIDEGWASREALQRLHAPIGLEIGSVSVQEIALSISAQLVEERAAFRKGKKRERIAAVILAAGESRRMGEPKMLLPFGDATIIRTVIQQAQNGNTNHVQVVLGADAEAIQAHITDLGVEHIVNQQYRKGMLSSVQAGIRSLPEEITAVMILLGDQPMISSGIMDRLIERYRISEKDIVIATADGKRGHPMIFNAAYIPEILSYNEENTLRDLPGKHPGEVEELETGEPGILRDIDTPADYKNERSAMK